MAETLRITSTRKSPYELRDIGYKDGDLTTLTALAEDIASTSGLLAEKYIPIKWISEYGKEAGPEVREILDLMLEARREVL